MNTRKILMPIAASVLLMSTSVAVATSHSTTPPPAETRSSVPQITGQQKGGDAKAGKELAQAAGCNNCHAVETKKMASSYQDIAKRHKGKAGAQAELVTKLQTGTGHPKTKASEAELQSIVAWILAM
jgi:cytochrome c551/c552